MNPPLSLADGWAGAGGDEVGFGVGSDVGRGVGRGGKPDVGSGVGWAVGRGGKADGAAYVTVDSNAMATTVQTIPMMRAGQELDL